LIQIQIQAIQVEKIIVELVDDFCHLDYCPLECDTYSFDIHKDLVITPRNGNIKSSKSLFGITYPLFNTFENASQNFYGIRVFYQDLKYTLISQQPKIEVFGLISNLGGILGLFLCFSFLSILELFEVVAELLYIRLE